MFPIIPHDVFDIFGLQTGSPLNVNMPPGLLVGASASKISTPYQQ